MTTKQDLLELRNEINTLLKEFDRMVETVPGEEYTVEHPSVPGKQVTMEFKQGDLDDVRQQVNDLRSSVKQKANGQDFRMIEAPPHVDGNVGQGQGNN